MKLKINKKNNRKGFTFIEIIMSVAIMVFLSAAMFKIITVSETQGGLILNAEKVKSGIRLAQAYSLSIPPDLNQRDVCGFGVHLSGGTAMVYYLYNTDYDGHPEACNNSSVFDYTPSWPVIKKDKKNIKLDSDYSVSGSEIFFKAPYSEVYSNNTELSEGAVRNVTITKSGQSKVITINGAGKINL